MRISDWSSDVCSSDLVADDDQEAVAVPPVFRHPVGIEGEVATADLDDVQPLGGVRVRGAFLHPLVELDAERSEERRVGKSVSVRVDLGGRRIIKKKHNRILNHNDHNKKTPQQK